MDDTASTNTPPMPPIPSEETFVTTETSSNSSPVSSSPSTNQGPKRKIGPIIATIFGILLLVGGVTAGLALVNQPEIFQQKASNSCVGLPKCYKCGFDICDNGYIMKDSLCTSGCVGNQTNPNPAPTIDPNVTKRPTCDYVTYCSSCGKMQCNNGAIIDVSQSVHPSCFTDAFCLSARPAPTPVTQTLIGGGSSSCTTPAKNCSTSCANGKTFSDACPATFGSCDQWATQACATVGSTPGGGGGAAAPAPNATPGVGGTISLGCSGTSCTVSRSPSCSTTAVTTFYCPGGLKNGACLENQNSSGTLSGGQQFSLLSYTRGQTCGAIQVDLAFGSIQDGCGAATYTIGSACTTAATPAPAILAPGNTVAPITAMCQAVQTYDINWNLLSQAQLSQLKTGDKIYFTVTGSTTSGSFDKARFTINGILQPDTVLLKPGTTQQFYNQYTIPAGTTSFTVTAQLHQVTLDQWF